MFNALCGYPSTSFHPSRMPAPNDKQHIVRQPFAFHLNLHPSPQHHHPHNTKFYPSHLPLLKNPTEQPTHHQILSIPRIRDTPSAQRTPSTTSILHPRLKASLCILLRLNQIREQSCIVEGHDKLSRVEEEGRTLTESVRTRGAGTSRERGEGVGRWKGSAQKEA